MCAVDAALLRRVRECERPRSVEPTGAADPQRQASLKPKPESDNQTDPNAKGSAQFRVLFAEQNRTDRVSCVRARARACVGVCAWVRGRVCVRVWVCARVRVCVRAGVFVRVKLVRVRECESARAVRHARAGLSAVGLAPTGKVQHSVQRCAAI
jgi:hypothetical protein